MGQIDTKNSSDSQLKFKSICSIGIFTIFKVIIKLINSATILHNANNRVACRPARVRIRQVCPTTQPVKNAHS